MRNIADMDTESCVFSAFGITIVSACVGSAIGAKILGPLGAVIGIFVGPIILWYGMLFGFLTLASAARGLDQLKRKMDR